MRITFRGRTFLNLWSVGSEARAIWAQSMMLDPKEGITGAQTIRNMVMGCSILAAAIAVLAGQLILLVTDGSRLDQVSRFDFGIYKQTNY